MHTHQPFSQQRGVALITVMVILLLSIIAVLAAGRTGLLNEALVGNDSDYGRALAAAEALMRDAETDVRGRTDQGFLCRPTPGNPSSNFSETNFIGCRLATPGSVFFPEDQAQYEEVWGLVNAVPATPCVQGICMPNLLNTLLGFEDAPVAAAARMATMAPLGVRYGTYTRGSAPPPWDSALNQILTNNFADPTQPQQGWYWVEVFPWAPVPGAYSRGAPPLAPDQASKFIYRITAIALGQKPGTRAVLRSFFVPNPTKTP